MKRLSRLALALCVFAVFLGSVSGQKPWHLVRYGKNQELRDQLIREGRVYADLGARVVAKLDLQKVRSLTKAGVHCRSFEAPRKGERLAAVFIRDPFIRDPLSRPSGVRILLRDRNWLLLAGSRPQIESQRRAGLFHGGVQEILLDQPYQEAKFSESPGAGPLANDPIVTAMVSKISKTNLTAHIKALSTLQTRNARSTYNALAIKYIKTQLAKIPGVTVKTETFNSRYGPNVIAEIKGKVAPTEIVMVGAHLDSLVWGGITSRSPGADDNASGTSAVLEIARVFAGIPTRRTVRFGFWNAEEYGLIGSVAYAAAAKRRGDKIVAYLNTDMNAYRKAGDTVDVDFVRNDSTASLINTLTTLSKAYVPKLGVKAGYLRGGTSDHRSFFRQGFPAVFYFEDLDKYSPYIHRSTDDMVRSTNDMNLATLITQSATAGLATLAKPMAVPSFTLSVRSGPSVGGTSVLVTGTSLSSATLVKVGGRPVSFSTAGGFRFVTPASKVLGSVAVEITNAAGVGRASYTYVLTNPPALRVTPIVTVGGRANLAIGGNPTEISVCILSGVLGTTKLGPISIDIANGNFANLFMFHTGVLVKGGGTIELPFKIPSDPKLKGVKLHFQAVHLTTSLTNLRKTNVGTMSIS